MDDQNYQSEDRRGEDRVGGHFKLASVVGMTIFTTGFSLPGWTLTDGDGASLNIYQYTQSFNFPFTPDG
jgi:hypothetical protein